MGGRCFPQLEGVTRGLRCRLDSWVLESYSTLSRKTPPVPSQESIRSKYTNLSQKSNLQESSSTTAHNISQTQSSPQLTTPESLPAVCQTNRFALPNFQIDLGEWVKWHISTKLLTYREPVTNGKLAGSANGA